MLEPSKDKRTLLNWRGIVQRRKKLGRRILYSLGTFVVVLFTACATTKGPSPSRIVLSAPKTVVVADFEGGSIPPREETRFWNRALATLLIADLRASENLNILDRQHLADVLREQQLSSSNLADPATRLHLGRILGANYFIFGTYTILGNTAFLTARLDNVETGQVVKSDKREGSEAEMRSLSRQLSIVFLRELDLRLAEQEEKEIATFGGPPPQAVRYFSEGLDYEQRRLYEQASERYSRALAVYPQYQEARKHLEKVYEQAARGRQ